MAYDFGGKVALITGSSRGTGKATALRLARDGCDIVINYLANEQAALQAAEEVRALGVRGEVVQADVGDLDQIKALFARVGLLFGGLDFLINNAATGLQRPRPAVKQMPGHLKKTFDVNLFGPWFCSQQAAPLMEGRGGGRIVNLISLGDVIPWPRYSAVGVTKGALRTLGIYLAAELGPMGITVNTVSGGLLAGTDVVELMFGQVMRRLEEALPIRRHVTPEDMANAIAFLCSDEAAAITGQTLIVDAGLTITTEHIFQG